MRLRTCLCLVALAAALGGCAGADSAGGDAVAAAPVWTEPSDYAYTLESSCGERLLIGKFAVTVAGGKVTKTRGLDDSSRRVLMLRVAGIVPTLGALAEQAETARREGADEVVLEKDPVDGHPVTIRIDTSRDSIDDESCYVITDYKAG